MGDDDSIDRLVIFTYEDVEKRWGINRQTLLGILEKYNLEIHIDKEDKKYRDFYDGQMRVFLMGTDQTPYIRMSIIKEFEQTNSDLFKNIKAQSALVPGVQAPLAHECSPYTERMIKARSKGKYTEEQAHYWRSRAVFRYFHPGVLNSKDLDITKLIKKYLDKDFENIIQFGCENVRYGHSEIRRWIEQSCSHPGVNAKGPKPWEVSTLDNSKEAQMRRSSRHRECVEAIAMIIDSKHKRLCVNDVIKICCEDRLEDILDSVREETQDDIKDGKPENEDVKKWIGDFLRSLRRRSDENM